MTIDEQRRKPGRRIESSTKVHICKKLWSKCVSPHSEPCMHHSSTCPFPKCVLSIYVLGSQLVLGVQRWAERDTSAHRNCQTSGRREQWSNNHTGAKLLLWYMSSDPTAWNWSKSYFYLSSRTHSKLSTRLFLLEPLHTQTCLLTSPNIPKLTYPSAFAIRLAPTSFSLITSC